MKYGIMLCGLLVLRVTLAGAAPVAVAADAVTEPETQDLSKLEGTWRAVGYKENGVAADPARILREAFQVTIRGDRWIEQEGGNKNKLVARFKIWGTGKTRHIDITYDALIARAKSREAATVAGLIRVEGDTLILATASRPGKARPESLRGEQGIVTTFKRALPPAPKGSARVRVSNVDLAEIAASANRAILRRPEPLVEVTRGANAAIRRKHPPTPAAPRLSRPLSGNARMSAVGREWMRQAQRQQQFYRQMMFEDDLRRRAQIRRNLDTSVDDLRNSGAPSTPTWHVD